MFKNLQTSQSFSIALNCLFLFLLLLASLFFWLSSSLSAQEVDKLAVKIYTNPNGYSAERWYNDRWPEDDPRRGTPLSIADVDGYAAVQDGRTVYVNAGNLEEGVYHANIYTLGFSQEPNSGTTKVYDNILQHWTFNRNLIEPDDYGTCSIPTKVCLTDSDCFSGYVCRVDDGSANGDYPEEIPALLPSNYLDEYYDNKCHLPIEKEINTTCWRDKDCKLNRTGLYCSGIKAEVTRRTKRLANLADIKSRFADFLAEDEDNTLPDFSAGSYMPGITLSTWNSWNETDTSLANLIHGGDLPGDPINAMGACAGFDPETCWDDVLPTTFDGSFDGNDILLGPEGSSVYGYSFEAEVVYSFSDEETIICPLNGDNCCTRGEADCPY